MPEGRDGCREWGLQGCSSCRPQLHPKSIPGVRDAGPWMLSASAGAPERCPRAGMGSGKGSARMPRLQPPGRRGSSGQGCAGTGRVAPGRELNE